MFRDAPHRGVRRQVQAEAARVEHLGHQAAVGQRGRVAMAAQAGLRVARQLRLDGFQAQRHPVVYPGGALRVGGLQGAGEVVEHAQVVQRVDVAGHAQRQRAHAGAAHGALRQQRGRGVRLFQVFEEGERLRERGAPVLQRGHERGRVHGAVGGLELLAAAAQQVHGHAVIRQPLERERDAHAVGGRAAEVGVEPQHGHSGAGTRRTVWSMAPKMLCPVASNISMRTRSPKRRKGVTGAPPSMVSTMRSSARQA